VSAPAQYVNIGGGPGFKFDGWLNLDDVPGQESSFNLSPECRFPVADRSIRLVYSSHTIEHLDDATVDQCLSEAQRMMRNNADLVIKIPDFDRTKKAWLENDSNFFRDELWNFCEVAPTWTHRGVANDMDSRASMIFCGWWTNDLVNHFAGKQNFTSQSYHGPAAMPPEEFRTLMNTKSPHAISHELSSFVRRTEKSFSFNHQNSWSAQELTELLKKHEFTVLTFDADQIIKRFGFVYGMDIAKSTSLYCWATKNTGPFRLALKKLRLRLPFSFAKN
jgi:hypothetical protein